MKTIKTIHIGLFYKAYKLNSFYRKRIYTDKKNHLLYQFTMGNRVRIPMERYIYNYLSRTGFSELLFELIRVGKVQINFFSVYKANKKKLNKIYIADYISIM